MSWPFNKPPAEGNIHSHIQFTHRHTKLFQGRPSHEVMLTCITTKVFIIFLTELFQNARMLLMTPLAHKYCDYTLLKESA